MPTHVTGTREDWLKTRLALLQAEKDLTRRSDEVAHQRQALPWVPIDNGQSSLRERIVSWRVRMPGLVGGRSQYVDPNAAAA